MGCSNGDRHLSQSIEDCVAKLGAGSLTQEGLRNHVWQLFSRVLASQSERGEIYLANHSLGRPLDQTSDDVARGLEIWYSKMDNAWDNDGWPNELALFRKRVASLIGLSQPDAVIPKSSAGQGLRAVLNSFPPNKVIQIVASRGEFDSIDHILKSYAVGGRAQVTWVEPVYYEEQLPLFDHNQFVESILPETDLVVVSQVFFSTAQIFPHINLVAQKAHDVGAQILVDAYHSAGVIPIDMDSNDFDFMIGGSYKYCRGGPGACWLAINPKLLNGKLQTLDTGWYAKDKPFNYNRTDKPTFAKDGDAWLESTPPVLTYFQSSAGLRLILAISIERLREYNLWQLSELRTAFKKQNVMCHVPSEPADFGAFCLLHSKNAPELSSALKQKGLVTDARGNFVRFGPDILNSVEEFHKAAKIVSSTIT